MSDIDDGLIAGLREVLTAEYPKFEWRVNRWPPHSEDKPGKVWPGGISIVPTAWDYASGTKTIRGGYQQVALLGEVPDGVNFRDFCVQSGRRAAEMLQRFLDKNAGETFCYSFHSPSTGRPADG